MHLLVFILIYGMVALSLNVASGFTQLISLAQAGFFGVGAYTTAILSTLFGWPLWINLLAGVVLAGLLVWPVAFLIARTVEDYFIICTMGLGIVLYSLMNNWMSLTHGPMGIPGIPAPTLFGHSIMAKWEWLLFVGASYFFMYWLVRNLKRSALGRILVAISEDEVLCQSFGKNVGLVKLQSFVLGAMLATIPGALYAHYVSFIDPTSFKLSEAIFMLSIVIIGGMGNLWGSLLATALVLLVPEGLRFIGLPSAIAANVQQVLYGLALVLVIAFRYSQTRDPKPSEGLTVDFDEAPTGFRP